MATIIKKKQPSGISTKNKKRLKNQLKMVGNRNQSAEKNAEISCHPEIKYHERAYQGVVNAFRFLNLVREYQQKT